MDDGTGGSRNPPSVTAMGCWRLQYQNTLYHHNILLDRAKERKSKKNIVSGVSPSSYFRKKAQELALILVKYVCRADLIGKIKKLHKPFLAELHVCIFPETKPGQPDMIKKSCQAI